MRIFFTPDTIWFSRDDFYSTSPFIRLTDTENVTHPSYETDLHYSHIPHAYIHALVPQLPRKTTDRKCVALPKRALHRNAETSAMAVWSVNFRLRRLFLKRRLLFLVLVVLPFIGCFIFFVAPDVRFSIPVVEKPSSANVSHDCICASTRTTEDNIAKETEASTPERKLERDISTSFGSLNVHMWSEICGMSVDTLRNWPHFPYFPSQRSFVSKFRRTQLPSVDSGERIFGFVHPQVSGMYKFAITSDDTSELWLSRNEDPASSEMIARVYSPDGSAWTAEGDYKKYPEQISKEILLHAGKKYYIESLSKQGAGAAHVAVYWSYRNTSFEIISSRYLSNFSANSNHETIPPHAGRQNITSFQSKSTLYYFYRLPLFNKKDYINSIPSCTYSPSFLVRRKLSKYEAAWNWMANESHVFPQDDTDMMKSDFRPYWTKPNALADNNRIKSVVDKFVISLRSR